VKNGKLVEVQEATRVGRIEDSTGAVRRAEVEVSVQEPTAYARQ